MVAKKNSRPEAEEVEETKTDTAEVEADSLASETKPEPKRAPEKKPTPAVPYAVVGPGETDTVAYSAAQRPSKTGGRKSLTVHHLQRRLKELGFPTAYADIDGRYGDLTELGVKQYQDSIGAEATGVLTREQFTEVFKDDINVSIMIDTHKDHG